MNLNVSIFSNILKLLMFLISNNKTKKVNDVQ